MKLPRRALVVGLARSGQAAALALARRGVPTVAVDRAAGVDAGRLAQAGVEEEVADRHVDEVSAADQLRQPPGQEEPSDEDRDHAKRLSYSGIVRALANLERSGWDLAGQFVAVNAQAVGVVRRRLGVSFRGS